MTLFRGKINLDATFMQIILKFYLLQISSMK